MSIKPSFNSINTILKRNLSFTSPALLLQTQSRVRIVDNSKLGKEGMQHKREPYIIHSYNLKKGGKGFTGDRLLLAVKGEKVQALLIGTVYQGESMLPKFDSNNAILIDKKEGNPLGSRILAPVPNYIKRNNHSKVNYAKIFSIAAKVI